MATAAARRVFGTTELLEHILLHLLSPRPLDEYGHPDPRDLMSQTRWHLFTIQRTCRTFRDTIQGSIALRRGLLLEPPAACESLSVKIDNDLRFMRFRFDENKKSFFFFLYEEEEEEEQDQNPDEIFLHWFERRFTPDDQAHASWRQLYLSKYQYLIKSIRTTVEVYGVDDRHTVTGHWLNPKLGAIFDEARQLAEEQAVYVEEKKLAWRLAQRLTLPT